MCYNIFPTSSSFLFAIIQSDSFIIRIFSHARFLVFKLVFISHLTMEVIGRRFSPAYHALVKKIHFLNHGYLSGIEYEGQNLI